MPPSSPHPNPTHASAAIPLSNSGPKHSVPPFASVSPESIFGWPAFLTAFQSFLTSFSLFRLLASTATHTAHSTQRLLSTPSAMSAPTYPPTELPPAPRASDDDSNIMLPVAELPPLSQPAGMSGSTRLPSGLRLTSLPDELIAMCYADLAATDLVALEHVSHRLRTLIADDALCWKRCVLARWAHLTSNSSLFSAAARHAGSWKTLYSEKAVCDGAHKPWLVLCRSEILAVLDVIKGDAQGLTPAPWGDSVRLPGELGGDDEDEDEDEEEEDDDVRDHGVTAVIAAPTGSGSLPASPPTTTPSVLPGVSSSSSPVSVVSAATAVQGPVLSVVLLLDASSSVTDEDFGCMKRFALNLVENLRYSVADAAVAVVQFNQHPRVEAPLTKVGKSKLSTSIENMDQLMGSTDIAAPIRRARQILAEEALPGDRVIVLLTDGQTHADELCESEKEAKKAYDEVGARLYTLGVGRDIDENGLGRVAGGSEGGMHFTLRRLLSSK